MWLYGLGLYLYILIISLIIWLYDLFPSSKEAHQNGKKGHCRGAHRQLVLSTRYEGSSWERGEKQGQPSLHPEIQQDDAQVGQLTPSSKRCWDFKRENGKTHKYYIPSLYYYTKIQRDRSPNGWMWRKRRMLCFSFSHSSIKAPENITNLQLSSSSMSQSL